MDKVILVALALVLSGCSVLMPYETEFQCKRPDGTGKCVSVEEAYQEALGKHGAPEYESEQYRELAGLLREPETPIVAPAKVVRTLILAYSDNESEAGRLFMPRFVYSIEQKPKFVMGQYQLQDDVGIDIFKMLESKPE